MGEKERGLRRKKEREREGDGKFPGKVKVHISIILRASSLSCPTGEVRSVHSLDDHRQRSPPSRTVYPCRSLLATMTLPYQTHLQTIVNSVRTPANALCLATTLVETNTLTTEHLVTFKSSENT